MPIVGQATCLRRFRGDLLHHAFEHQGEAARLGHRLGVGQHLFGLRIVAAAGAVAAERIDRLRGQPDMADHRNAALRQEGDGRRHRLAALELHRRGAGLLQHPRGVAERLLGAFLIGAERHVDATRACHEPRTTAAPCAHIISRLTGMVEGRP